MFFFYKLLAKPISALIQDPKFKPEYWSRYYDYLLRKPSWSITAVEDINSSTDEIMNALTNPRKGVAGERMGMVFGYVQSGKTAHYIGMIIRPTMQDIVL